MNKYRVTIELDLMAASPAEAKYLASGALAMGTTEAQVCDVELMWSGWAEKPDVEEALDD